MMNANKIPLFDTIVIVKHKTNESFKRSFMGQYYYYTYILTHISMALIILYRINDNIKTDSNTDN